MSSDKSASNEFILKASCSAARGIVAGVTTFLSDKACYISELAQFDDEITGRFFMRAVCRAESPQYRIEDIRKGFVDAAARFSMQWQIFDLAIPSKVLIMVSRADHCFDNLLYRHRKGELPMEITAVVSNHKDLRPMAEREGIRFVHLPVDKDNRQQQEEALLEIVRETGTELVILARYMQILSDPLCAELKGCAINIHHSFLPGFKGAKPYHQAYERGVKLIGATAHYVTPDLDEGPIIEQSVQQVDHSYTPEMLVAVGRDTETMALARAVKLHIEHRVFLDGKKTVVFR